jgi:hypothetical protein
VSTKDVYGIVDTSRWEKEMEYFITRGQCRCCGEQRAVYARGATTRANRECFAASSCRDLSARSGAEAGTRRFGRFTQGERDIWSNAMSDDFSALGACTVDLTGTNFRSHRWTQAFLVDAPSGFGRRGGVVTRRLGAETGAQVGRGSPRPPVPGRASQGEHGRVIKPRPPARPPPVLGHPHR